MTVGLLSSRGVAIADVHPWKDVYEAPVLNVTDSPRMSNYRQSRTFHRASVNFFVEVETPKKSTLPMG